MDEREDRIRQRAHAIWEAEGRPEGRHEAHWQQACAEIEGTGGTDGAVAQMQGGEAPQPGGDANAGAAPRTTRSRKKV
jgi:hypothetical protein